MFELVITLGVVLMILQVGDVSTTVFALQHGLKEKNPLAKWAFSHLGIKISLLIKLGVVGIVTIYMVLLQEVWPLIGLVMLYAFVNGWNVGKIVASRRGRA